MADLEYKFDVDNKSKTTNQPKLIYAGDTYNDQPYIASLDEGVFIAASKTDSINVTSEFGVQLNGEISISAMPDQISIAGGYFRLNPLLLTCLPSTTITPIPTLVRATPRILEAKDSITSGLSILSADGL